jgi:hypothetical protein
MINMMTQAHKFLGLAFLLTLLVPGLSLADEEEEYNTLNCVHANRIRNTKVVDDLRILFYMRGGSDYVNILPRQCRGLSREGRFSYRVSVNTLCKQDSIRILRYGATGLEDGNSCRLGSFHEVTEEDIEMILDQEPRLPPPEPLPSAEPEEIIKETDESR